MACADSSTNTKKKCVFCPFPSPLCSRFCLSVFCLLCSYYPSWILKKCGVGSSRKQSIAAMLSAPPCRCPLPRGSPLQPLAVPGGAFLSTEEQPLWHPRDGQARHQLLLRQCTLLQLCLQKLPCAIRGPWLGPKRSRGYSVVQSAVLGGGRFVCCLSFRHNAGGQLDQRELLVTEPKQRKSLYAW